MKAAIGAAAAGQSRASSLVRSCPQGSLLNFPFVVTIAILVNEIMVLWQFMKTGKLLFPIVVRT